MFKTILTSWLTTITSIFIIFFYNTNNPLIKNELYNSVVLTNKDTHTFYLHRTGLNIPAVPIKIENSTNYISTVNIDYVIQQNNMHTNVNIGVISVIITIMVMTILSYKIKSTLYKHEIYKIETRIKHVMKIIIITLLFFKENIINIIIKKNITLPEMLFETEQIYSIIEIGMLVVYILIYNYILKKRITKENKKIIHTKIGVQSITLLLLITAAQYSIYEILMVILYAEIMHQYTNVILLNTKHS